MLVQSIMLSIQEDSWKTLGYIIVLTLSWVHAYMSHKLHTCPITTQEMGKVWKFTRATPLLPQVRAKHPTSHIATVQQALNTSTTHTNI